MVIEINTSKLKWKWNDQLIPLNKLKDGQLYFVKNFINKHKNKYLFNINKKIWLKEINSLIEKRQQKNINIIHNQIIGRRIQNAQLNANWIIRMIK